MMADWQCFISLRSPNIHLHYPLRSIQLVLVALQYEEAYSYSICNSLDAWGRSSVCPAPLHGDR